MLFGNWETDNLEIINNFTLQGDLTVKGNLHMEMPKFEMNAGTVTIVPSSVEVNIGEWDADGPVTFAPTFTNTHGEEE